MDVMAMLARELASKIEQAFDGMTFPGPEHRSISQAEAWDNYEKCDQSRDFKGRWQDLPLEDFIENQWSLPHLDAHGFTYYLPALMTAIVRGDDIGPLLGDSLLLFLCRGAEHPQLALLNEHQLSVTKEFVEFCQLRENSKNW